MIRSISFSEISTMLDCQAKHDFAYGDQLVGSALKPKAVAPQLSGGRAWGQAIAQWHVNFTSKPTDEQRNRMVTALDRSLDLDAERQREFGVHDDEVHRDLRQHLLDLLAHETEIAPRLGLEPGGMERELDVPIPSRTGGRSNRYRLLSYLDGWRMSGGHVWLVEFKLRKQLTSVEQITLSRQIRWYAWAWWQTTGIRPMGVEVVERLNVVPKPARVLKNGTVSTAKDQLCTADAYLAACAAHETEPDADTEAALRARRWRQVVPVIFRPSELDEVGDELVSAAQQIAALDSGAIMPLRNPSRMRCPGCAFAPICTTPDPGLIEALYERISPKRERPV